MVNLDGMTETLPLKSLCPLFQQDIYSRLDLPLGLHKLIIILLEDRKVAIDVFEVLP